MRNFKNVLSNVSSLNNIKNKKFSKKLSNLNKFGEFKFNFKNFQNDLSLHKTNIKNRNSDANAELVVKLFLDFSKKRDDINLMKQQINKLKQLSSQLTKENKASVQLNKDTKKHVDDVIKLEKELAEIESNLMKEALLIPNLTHPEAPVGDEKQMKLIKTINDKRKRI